MSVSEIASKAAAARWLWKARRARQTLSLLLSEHGQSLDGEWCNFDESAFLTEHCRELGISRERMIQAWPSKQDFVQAAHSCASGSVDLDEAYCLIMDFSDAGWVKVQPAAVFGDLIRAAGAWLTDGFLLYFPSSSLLSVDIEDRNDRSIIESTLIGEDLAFLRSCLQRLGPSPQQIHGP
jgi:hypothetical protein